MLTTANYPMHGIAKSQKASTIYHMGHLSSSGAKLTFLDRVNEVGGVKTLLNDKDNSILLDFGKGFFPQGKYLEENLNPCTPNGSVHFIEMGIIPEIEGIHK